MEDGEKGRRGETKEGRKERGRERLEVREGWISCRTEIREEEEKEERQRERRT